ncbi:MAG: hypothetical protein JWM12_4176, partial [Ilumatobacteraceae bacterium]|nr:hypothetical protein [Ilumatobacteraceae bacterium]
MHDEPTATGLERGVIIGETPAEALAAAKANADADVQHTWADVPWRPIIGTVGVVLCTYLLIQIVLVTVSVITWIVVAGFFAIVLAPAVRRVQHRVGRRALATSIVVFSTLGGVIGLISLFLLPVRSQLIAILTDLPGT